MTKRNFHEIICPNCDSSYWIKDTFNYFKTEQKCDNCKNIIPTGESGLKEQVKIFLKRNASIRAIKLVREARKNNQSKARRFVKQIARENNLTYDRDVSGIVSFFVRIIVSGVLGLAVVGIGSIFVPSLQKIVAPIVCQGELSFEKKKIKTDKTKIEADREFGAELHFYCDDEDISKKVFTYSIIAYSLLIFILIYLWKFLRNAFK